MRVALALSLSIPFALPWAVRTLLFPYGSAGTLHLDPLKCTTQIMLCIGLSEHIYRYRSEKPCALLVRSRRWRWRSPFLGLPSPCPIRYYEHLTFILFEGAQLIEKIRDRPLLTNIQIHTQTSPPGLGILPPQCIPMTSTNFHKLPKSFKVRSAARHFAQGFKVLLITSFLF